MNVNNDLIHGRKELYDLVIQEENARKCKTAIEDYRKSLNDSMNSLPLYRSGVLNYNFHNHKFTRDIANLRTDPSGELKIKADQLLVQVHKFIEKILVPSTDKGGKVHRYVLSKVLRNEKKESITKEQFLNDPKAFEIASDKFSCLLTKIENTASGKKDGGFKSQEEKTQKKEYLTSDQYKIDQLKKEMRPLENRLDKPVSEILELSKENCTCVVDKAQETLREGQRRSVPISNQAQKELKNIIENFKRIKAAIERKQTYKELIDGKNLSFISEKNHVNYLSDRKILKWIKRAKEKVAFLNLDVKKFNESRMQLDILQEKKQSSDSTSLEVPVVPAVRDIPDQSPLEVPEVPVVHDIPDQSPLEVPEVPVVHDIPDQSPLEVPVVPAVRDIPDQSPLEVPEVPVVHDIPDQSPLEVPVVPAVHDIPDQNSSIEENLEKTEERERQVPKQVKKRPRVNRLKLGFQRAWKVIMSIFLKIGNFFKNAFQNR